MKLAPITTRKTIDAKRAIIPFDRPPIKALERGQYHTYKLRTTPADASSPVYELAVPFFDSGTPEEWIKFRRGLKAVLKGQNVTTGPPSFAVAKTLLKGDALTVFESSSTTHGAATTANFQTCLDDVAAHVFPDKAGQTQKRYLRRNLRKDASMTVKEWVARVMELNAYLTEFPAHNGTDITELDDAEIMDILEYGVPPTWRREFTVQGFDPADQGRKKFVEFCTRLESCEPAAEKSEAKKGPSKQSGKRKASTASKSADTSDAKFDCELHGRNHTHDTADCYELKRRAKKAKRDNEDKKVSYKDLNAFVNAKVADAFKKAKSKANNRNAAKDKKKELNAFAKFRNLQVDESSDEEQVKPEPTISVESSSDSEAEFDE